MSRRLDFLSNLRLFVGEVPVGVGRSHPAHASALTRDIVARQDAKPLLILHVEDDDNDALLFQKACERAGLPARLHRVDSADEAKAYLLGQGIYADRSAYPVPHVVVLDLKMPRTDGFELLKWMRHTEPFAALPILIFTASMSGEDKSRAMAEGASSYFVKPSSFEAMVKMVESFGIVGGRQWN